MGTKPALITGTSREYLGRRPLPRALRQRPLVTIGGPAGVGKTSVAKVIAGPEARYLDCRALRMATVWFVRRNHWSKALLSVPALIIDGPVFLLERPAAAAAIQLLIRQRVAAGLRTVICEGSVRDGSISLLMDAADPLQRATLNLRFPVGRGKLRLATRLCDEQGIPRGCAKGTVDLEPWTYETVRAELERLGREGGEEG